MTVIAAKWTIEEYHRMVAAGILCDLALGEALRDRSVELLKGEIIEMPRPREPSAYCSDEAGEYLTKLLGNVRGRVPNLVRHLVNPVLKFAMPNQLRYLMIPNPNQILLSCNEGVENTESITRYQKIYFG